MVGGECDPITTYVLCSNRTYVAIGSKYSKRILSLDL